MFHAKVGKEQRTQPKYWRAIVTFILFNLRICGQKKLRWKTKIAGTDCASDIF